MSLSEKTFKPVTNMSLSENALDRKLKRLADHMRDMSENDMGNLIMAEAALFHTACTAINFLIEVRGIELEN